MNDEKKMSKNSFLVTRKALFSCGVMHNPFRILRKVSILPQLGLLKKVLSETEKVKC